ncbi:hypothetical protein LTR48_002917 [Friedmanniomyces endolithicus]|uniref:AB hydrolase-1 domain-containing protein n=1 Tax=Rachicladosporium monterosium TaxID=1507873 RepID=A0ABR0LAQ1_9PEZI|nr:hypothetical protein LTR48_002917 [Friedmanniomyces endolithicus]KAK5145571.1 hypothetical protein LTR32_002703 [Rachicladosporium monterosium]
MSSVAAAKIVSQRTYPVGGKLNITEHFFDVPKDHSKPEGGTIRVFARSVKKRDTAIVPDSSKDKEQLPWMCYLQGGPGLPCRAPQHYNFTQTILDRGYQLLYLDQRGTGLSTPLTASTLGMRGNTDVQARHLKLHRADSIVKDCEAIRQALTADWPEEKKKWSIIGQSFGNEAYFAKFPEDVARVKTIMNYLSRFGDGKIKLPSEGTLTRRRFRQIGINLGFHGGLDMVHDIVLRAACDVESFGHLTRGTLSTIDQATAFDEHLIYAILHEPLYCEGNAPNWSAHRLMSEYSVFDLEKAGDEPIYFTGEMIYPWMFEDYSELRKVQDTANRIALDSDWPALWDEQQLARNEVPVYAASYVEDMYVDFDLGMETARKVKGCKVFTTNVMFHDGMRSKMDEVFKQAFALRDDVVD